MFLSSTASRFIVVHLSTCIYDSHFIRTLEAYFKKIMLNKMMGLQYLPGTNVNEPSTEPEEVARGVQLS